MDFSTKELDTYPAIYEQDVDLVIVMALRASPKIRALFCDAVKISDRNLLFVRHSAPTLGGREADIEARFGSEDHPTVLQIEDKIDARFTPEQPQAYRERADTLAGRPDIADAFAILCAPQGYLDSAPDERRCFDATVSHEALRDALAQEGTWGRELALLVHHAILQHRRSDSIAPTDELLTTQLRAFAAGAAEVGLPVPKVGNRSGDPQIWVEKGALRSENGVEGFIRLLPSRGIVELELYGARRQLNIDALAKAEMDAEIRLSKRNIYITIEPPGKIIDLTVPLEEQREAVAEHWERAARLREWWDERGVSAVAQFAVTE